jgi:hypothetical protein
VNFLWVHVLREGVPSTHLKPAHEELPRQGTNPPLSEQDPRYTPRHAKPTSRSVRPCVTMMTLRSGRQICPSAKSRNMVLMKLVTRVYTSKPDSPAARPIHTTACVGYVLLEDRRVWAWFSRHRLAYRTLREAVVEAPEPAP